LTLLIDTGSDLYLIRASNYVKIGASTLRNEAIEFRGFGSDNVRLCEFTGILVVNSVCVLFYSVLSYNFK